MYIYIYMYRFRMVLNWDTLYLLIAGHYTSSWIVFKAHGHSLQRLTQTCQNHDERLLK